MFVKILPVSTAHVPVLCQIRTIDTAIVFTVRLFSYSVLAKMVFYFWSVYLPLYCHHYQLVCRLRADLLIQSMSFMSLLSLEQKSSLGFAKVLKRSIERAGLLHT